VYTLRKKKFKDFAPSLQEKMGRKYWGGDGDLDFPVSPECKSGVFRWCKWQFLFDIDGSFLATP